MPHETPHHISGSLPLAITLAATAGFVDAFVYLRVIPVFVANMSGNLIHVGIAVGDRDRHAVFAVVVALAGFFVGVAAAMTRVDVALRRHRSRPAADLLIAESGLLLVVASVLTATGIGDSPSVSPTHLAVVVACSMAMGIQAVALRRVGLVAVSTTYGTGAVVRLGEKVALAMRRTDRPGGHRRRVTIAVLSAVLASYVTGAFVGASVGVSPVVLFIPAVIPLFAAPLLTHPGE